MAVDSTKISPCGDTAGMEPVRISRDFWGSLAAILPSSEICRIWRVPERADTDTEDSEPLEKRSVSTAFVSRRGRRDFRASDSDS
ncbi:hypothetical protein FACS1894186_4760 [Alphaproteobacteria bacterium]|nr:hypothetical protein FACS1894186_4760 [Alphaproteobacteria bacterium]